jgi:hypothetical protein
MIQVVFNMICSRFITIFNLEDSALLLMFVDILFGGVAIFPNVSYILQVPETGINFKRHFRTLSHPPNIWVGALGVWRGRHRRQLAVPPNWAMGRHRGYPH